MKLVKPSFEIIEQAPGFQGLLKHVELCGRTAYKSEDKITEDSAEKFVNMIIDRGHTAVVEHGTVYLTIPFKQNDISNDIGYRYWKKYTDNQYSVAHQIQTKFEPMKSEGYVAITTNYRVLLDNDWLEDLEYLSEPVEGHEKRVTVKFICDRGISHEFVRHRVFSFVQESTRYCNYSKDKFDNQLTLIIPVWLTVKPSFHINSPVEEGLYLERCIISSYIGENKAPNMFYNKFYEDDTLLWLNSMFELEALYNKLIKSGWTPQQARSVLPNSLKTELIMTGTVKDWKGGYTKDGKPYGFFPLRCASGAHPQARELAIPLKEEFIKRGYVTD